MNFNCFVNCNTSSALHTFIQRSRSSDSITIKQRKHDFDDNAVVEIILGNAAHSVLERMELPEYTQFDCCRTMINHLRSDDILNAAKMKQSMAEWQNIRKLRITGSRIYSIFTFKKEDWSEKAVNYFWPKSFTSTFTEYGKKYEHHAVIAYKKQHPSYDIHYIGLAISKKYPWFGYSPDGIIFEDGKPIALLEIKCPYSGKENDAQTILEGCSYLEKEDMWLLKRKHSYYGQIQFGMALLNLKNTHFIIYSSASDTYYKIVVDFDMKFATSMLSKVNEMYFKNMIHHYCLNKDKF